MAKEKKLAEEMAEETNDAKIKAELEAKIEANAEIIEKLRLECVREAAEMGTKDHEVSSDECVENATVFNFMKHEQRVRHLKVLWIKVLKKAKAGY